MENIKNRNWMKVAIKESLKSKCIRAKRGAVAVKNNKVIASSYNKIFPDDNYCVVHGCIRDKLNLQLGFALEKCDSIHAETMLVAQAARSGIRLEEAEIYTTCLSCPICAKLLIIAGVKKVFYLDKYGSDEAEKLFWEMGVAVERVALDNGDKGKRLRDTKGQE